MENPFRYRNKAQYPVGRDKEGRVTAGFYAGRTHYIIPNQDCLLGPEENQKILQVILNYMEENHIPPYEEATGLGLVRHILIRKGFSTGEIMVCLVLNKKMTKLSYQARGTQKRNNEFLPNQGELLAKLARIQGMTSVSVSINTEKTNVIMGKEIHNLWGQPFITDVLHTRDMQREAYPVTERALTFKISPLSFYQVNPVQTEKLYSLALEYADLTGNEIVWDLYCGIGTISLFLAGRAKKVYGVEIVPQAIEDAKENAVLNGIENAEFFAGSVQEALSEDAFGRSILPPDVVVVDPPRKGCDQVCLAVMLKLRPERIVYVSCDSATLARDLKVLCDGGYEVKRIRGVDQFGMTVHVETVVQLVRKTPDAHIDLKIDMDELDITSSESKATYEKIKQYIADKYDTKVTNLYIAQVKDKHGIIERENYNKAKSEDSKQLKCPPEKEKMIEDALKYFKMI